METRVWSAEEIQHHFSDVHSLNQLIKRVEGMIWEKGEVICEVRVNGMFLDEKDEHRFANETLEHIQRLEIKTQNPNDLLFNTIQSAIEYLKNISSSALRASEYFRGGQIDEAHSLTFQLFETCRWLTETLLLIKKSAKSWVHLDLSTTNWQKIETAFIGIIKNFSSCYEHFDQVLLADLLEYDLSSICEQWMQVLEQVKKEIFHKMAK